MSLFLNPNAQSGHGFDHNRALVNPVSAALSSARRALGFHKLGNGSAREL
jgi:hypothetical protein